MRKLVSLGIVAVPMILVGSECAGAPPARTQAAPLEAKLYWGDACDPVNRRLYVENTHTYLGLSITVKLHVHAGKDFTETVYRAPGQSLELACAATAEILEAKYTEY